MHSYINKLLEPSSRKDGVRFRSDFAFAEQKSDCRVGEQQVGVACIQIIETSIENVWRPSRRIGAAIELVRQPAAAEESLCLRRASLACFTCLISVTATFVSLELAHAPPRYFEQSRRALAFASVIVSYPGCFR